MSASGPQEDFKVLLNRYFVKVLQEIWMLE